MDARLLKWPWQSQDVSAKAWIKEHPVNENLFSDLFVVETSGTESSSRPAPASIAEPPRLRWSNSLVFDCETGPLDEAELLDLFEVDLSKIKGYELIGKEFDPAAVKFGNTTDPLKRQAKVEAKREEHEKAQAAAQAALESAREEQWQAFVESAALSAVTGRVLAIGYGADLGNGQAAVETDTEADGEAALVERFWDRFERIKRTDGRIIGFNIFAFDLPFLIRRSWQLGVEVPGDLLRDARYWHRTFIDLKQIWACGVYNEHISLDRACQFFGGPRKCGKGSDFHRLYHGTAEEYAQAMDYLRNDIAMTWSVGRRMGVL